MATFSAETILRLREERLVQLTNDDRSATTIDTDRLDRASDDAQAMFRLETGIEPDNENPMHISVIVTGIQYYLETWNGRDSGAIGNLSKRWLGALSSVRGKRKILPATDSPLKPSEQRQDTLPDMDRQAPPFVGKGKFMTAGDYDNNQ